MVRGAAGGAGHSPRAGPGGVRQRLLPLSQRGWKALLASLEFVSVLSRQVEKQVLHQISFTIEPGQVVALVGSSGAGTCTIAQLLTRIYDPTAGGVKINGCNLRTRRCVRSGTASAW